MSRKPTGRASGRPRSKHLRATERRLTAKAYYLFRNEGIEARRLYEVFGGETAAKRATAEFATDREVQMICEGKWTSAQWIYVLKNPLRTPSVLGAAGKKAEIEALLVFKRLVDGFQNPPLSGTAN